MQTAPAADFDPVAEKLLTEGRERRFASLVGRERFTRWVSAGSVLAASVALLLLAPHERHASLLTYVALVGGFAIASRVRLEVGTGYTIPTELVLVPMLFLLPPASVPLLVAVALAISQLPEYVRGAVPFWRITAAIGNAAYALGPALVMVGFGSPGPGLRDWGILALALLAQYATDFTTSIAREWGALRLPPRQLVRPLLWVFMIDALLAPIGLTTAIAAEATKVALVLELPVLGLIWIFSREHTERLDHALELSIAYRGTAFVLGDVIETTDRYTGTHSREVVELVLAVCDDLGLDPRSRRKAEFAALLHDVGKIKIPLEIINKPGPLDADERAIINTHTIEGEKLLVKVGGLLSEVGVIVRASHERYDGTGYPDGLAGEAIPPIARIICCCDAFNAMTTDRPNRRALSLDDALAELAANRGSQFDPVVVDSVVGLVTTAEATPERKATEAPAAVPLPDPAT